MIIGVPRERKTLEKRVALTPQGAGELTSLGATVIVESQAGEGSFFSDDQYVSCGCKVVASLQEVWERADLIVKVKEPHAKEYQYFREGLVLFDYLHLAGLPKVAQVLCEEKVTGIAYELIQSEDGRLPLLEPMSEVAGKLSVQIGAELLLSQHGGRGVLLGGATGVPPADVLIIGAGIAGRAACRTALGMGARVTILDVNPLALQRVQQEFGTAPRALFSTPSTIQEECTRTDLLIGAVLIPGAKAPCVVREQEVRSMPAGSVIIDISIDQGGSIETIKPTTLEDPTYLLHDVLHYGVQNMPAQTARTSTRALTAATLPFIKRMVTNGIAQTLREDKIVRGAVCTYEGSVTNQPVAEALGMPFRELGVVREL